MADQLAQLLLNKLRILVQRLAKLSAQLLDLLLHEHQRLTLMIPLQDGLQATEKNPTDKYKADTKSKNKEKCI